MSRCREPRQSHLPRIAAAPPAAYFVGSAVFHYLGPVVRGAPVRAGRPARRRVAAGRERGCRRSRCGGDHGGRFGASRVTCVVPRRRARRDECLLLRRHRPASARHRRRDRVSAGDRPRRARRPHRGATSPRSSSRSRACTRSSTCGSRVSRSASRSRSRTPSSSPRTSCSRTGSRAPPRIDGLAAAMLVALVVDHADRLCGRCARAARPGRARRRDRRRPRLVRRSRTSSTSSRWRKLSRAGLLADGRRCCRRPPR